MGIYLADIAQHFFAGLYGKVRMVIRCFFKMNTA